MISFARGVPAPECLAVDELAECARAALERDGRTILSYGPGGGYGPLRETLAERHGVEPSRVVVTSGSLQGFVFLAEAERAGVTFVKGTDFFPGGRGGERALRLAFSFVSPEEIAEGVSVLGSLARSAAPAAF